MNGKTLGKIAIVAVLYFLTGQLGVLLAVPPGYASIIWPASGIGLGALLTQGAGMWPGVFIGSIVLNASIGGAFAPDTGWEVSKLIVAAGIAAGSTLQTLVGYVLVRRYIGIPIDLKSAGGLLSLLGLTGPLACIVAPGIGVATLYFAGILDQTSLAQNWLTWWAGDFLGVIVFLPLVLVLPFNIHQLRWRGARLGVLPVASVVVLLIPLGLTFYAWKATSHYTFEKAQSAFEGLAKENERALLHRMDSYNQSLLGAVGLLRASQTVSRAEWREYVNAIDIRNNFPGINGIGFILDIEPDAMETYLAEMRKSVAGFTIRPETRDRPNFIITYIEPIESNRQAVGLNIGFEDNRLNAASTARDTGHPAITKSILLVQDQTRSPGFLLLHPLYRRGMRIVTVAERQAALEGWVFSPFVARSFLNNLTDSQGDTIQLQVFDGKSEAGSVEIFNSGENAAATAKPAFSVTRQRYIMQQDWTLVWTSTPAFEQGASTNEPKLILAGGMIFAFLFGILLFVFARRAETVRRLVDQKTGELAESESQYRLLAEHSTDLICRIGLDGTRLYVSPASAQIFGFPPENFIGHKFFEALHPADAEAAHDKFNAVVRGETDTATIVFRERHADGRWVWSEARLRLVRSADGVPLEIVTITRDITKREEADCALRAANMEAESAKSRAERANQAKTEFLASMSHEIRTPLNSVIGFTGIILERGDLPDGMERQMKLIQTAGMALLTIVNDVLDFSKIEAGEIVLSPQTFSLAALVDNSVSIIRDSAEHKNLSLTVDIDDRIPKWVLGDDNRLSQILLNLLNNAIKFTEKGSVNLAVKQIETAQSGVQIAFAVRDTGIGISEKDRHRLFARFSQVDGSIQRRFGGTGLGLAISKRLVELMGGNLDVESEEGQGSEFTFWVLLAQAEEPVGNGAAAAHRGKAKSAHILLVEDLEVNQEIAMSILTRAGHTVDVASDGGQAIEAVQKNAYDLVLMDIQMPVVDGVTATREIRALAGAFADLPIIAMTANVLSDQVSQFKKAGMNDHIGKPVGSAKLLEMVCRWADREGVPERDTDTETETETETKSESLDTMDTTDTLQSSELPTHFDSDLFGELSELFEPAKLETFLSNFNGLVDQMFVERDDRDAVATRAHNMVSTAGLLGFRRLSELAHRLEVACRTDGEPEQILAEIEAAKQVTDRKLAEFRAAA